MKNQLTAAVVFFFTAASAAALTPATLLTPELEAQPINLAGLSGGTLSYFDDDRRLTRASVDDFVRLSLAADAGRTPTTDAESAPGVIELVDGQRIAGRWAGATRDGEAIVWTHRTLGAFTLGLDDVRRVVMAGQGLGDARDAGTAEGDTVTLVNGDRLVGFVVSVADDAVTILADGADAEVTLSLGTVAAVTLANPLTPPGEVGGAGDWVLLADGSRVRGGAIAIAGEWLRLTPTLTDAMAVVELELGEVRQIDFASAGLRLVELGDQPMRTVAGGWAFGLDFGPTVDAAGIRLHAPVTVEFELPAGVRRLAATASLDLPAGLSEERAAWADFELTVEPGEMAEPIRLRAASPEAPVNLTLNGPRQLRVELDPSAYGPVLDRLLLRDALLLIELPDPQPDSGDASP